MALVCTQTEMSYTTDNNGADMYSQKCVTLLTIMALVCTQTEMCYTTDNNGNGMYIVRNV
jgi:hypothetical protein